MKKLYQLIKTLQRKRDICENPEAYEEDLKNMLDTVEGNTIMNILTSYTLREAHNALDKFNNLGTHTYKMQVGRMYYKSYDKEIWRVIVIYQVNPSVQ